MDTIDCAPTRESKLALPYVLTRCVTITCLSNVGILFLGSGTETLILYNVSLNINSCIHSTSLPRMTYWS